MKTPLTAHSVDGHYELHANAKFIVQPSTLAGGGPYIPSLVISGESSWTAVGSVIPSTASECAEVCTDEANDLTFECRSFFFSILSGPGSRQVSCSLYQGTIYDSASKLQGRGWHIGHQSYSTSVTGTKAAHVHVEDSCTHQ